ncbi:MAG: DUF1838 domain-containing protein [Cyanobacteria bacterium P01_A01_bin.84]
MVANIREFETQDWVRVRSSLESDRSTFFVWTGTMYAFLPGNKRKLLFSMIGMNVNRCIPSSSGGWDFTSKELNYYLHPVTGEILRTWYNPWTEEVVPVMHVANTPVQSYFQGKFPAQIEGNNRATFKFDIFPTYPNPLAEDPKFAEYSPQPNYQAAELFKLTVSTKDLFDTSLRSIPQVQLNWDRIGQWLPWMKMGNRPGYLIYSACGSKIDSFTQLPELLQNEINHRLPSYKEAPTSYLKVEDMNAWLYFKQHFNAYLAGEIFPLPEVYNDSLFKEKIPA